MTEPDRDTVRRVIEQVGLQLQCFGQVLSPCPVETVYIGGGTPSLLSPRELDLLLEAVGRFVVDVDPAASKPDPVSVSVSEWTVEANPESLTRDHLEICAARGVNRISLGLQGLQDRILSTLGRPGGARESRLALELLRARWDGQVNLDLIAGVPGQDWPTLRRDLKRALASAPDHLSLYSLSLDDPDHPLARGSDPDAQDRLWLRGCRWLEEQGYQNYEISNFALPGHESRHNLRYWRLQPFLGVGPAAASTLPGSRGAEPQVAAKKPPTGNRRPDARPEGRFGSATEPSPGRGAETDTVLRLTNPRSISAFLEGPQARWGLEIEAVTPREFLLETLMMGLRLREGIDTTAFVERFGRPLRELLPGLWRRWTELGLLADRTGVDRDALTFEGRMILDRLLLEAGDELARIHPEELNVRWG